MALLRRSLGHVEQGLQAAAVNSTALAANGQVNKACTVDVALKGMEGLRVDGDVPRLYVRFHSNGPAQTIIWTC